MFTDRRIQRDLEAVAMQSLLHSFIFLPYGELIFLTEIVEIGYGGIRCCKVLGKFFAWKLCVCDGVGEDRWSGLCYRE